MHVHFHIIPKEPGGAGLGLKWDAGTAGPGAADLAKRIREAIPTG
jgi:diadenosine tetraphosphate (Ap4A) HIT family hydrolase